MPQPLTRIVPRAEVLFNPNVLADKPDMAALVCNIFAIWAKIEFELSLLMVRVLGADAAPALAMYAKLNTQNLQMVALEAAAKAALSADEFEVFEAMVSITDSVQTPRNHLAHWIWGGCKERPDLLVLADPRILKEREARLASHFQARDASKLSWNDFALVAQFDQGSVLAYSKADLERAAHDLNETDDALLVFEMFLHPDLKQNPLKVMVTHSPEEIRAEALRKLNEKRLFREALLRLQRKGQQSSPPETPESPRPEDQA
jgi:hypothetical protein